MRAACAFAREAPIPLPPRRSSTNSRVTAFGRSYVIIRRAPQRRVRSRNTDALPPKLPKLTNFIKLIEPRARRASPQGHGKSLPDAVKTIDFPSVLEGFWPNPSNRLRPSVHPPIRAKSQICDTVVRSELGGLKSAILSIIFFSHVQICDTVDLD